MKRSSSHDRGKHSPWSFYKLILSPSTQSHKLRIPQKFAMKFSDKLYSAVTLTVPTGESRRVRLIKENTTLWFSDGWKEFVEYFNIGYAYFLLFTYEGSSNFRVHIFDPTACEISHPYNARDSSQLVNDLHLGKISPGSSCKEEIDDDDDEVILEVLDSPLPNSNNLDVDVVQLDSEDELGAEEGSCKEEVDHGEEEVRFEVMDASFPKPNNFAVDVIELDSEDEHCVIVEKEISPCESIKHSNNNNRNNASQGTAPYEFPVWLRKSQGLMKAVAAAGISIPENPFFVAAMKPYFLKGQYLSVPIAFAREHLNCAKTANLEASNGRQWVVRCVRSPSRYNLGIGWIIFAHQNCLEVGDVCLFELTNAEKHVLKVHVAKKSQKRATRQIS